MGNLNGMQDDLMLRTMHVCAMRLKLGPGLPSCGSAGHGPALPSQAPPSPSPKSAKVPEARDVEARLHFAVH